MNVKQKVQTNADKIRNFSDEDLANFLNNFSCGCLTGGSNGECLSKDCQIKHKGTVCSAKDIYNWLISKSK